MKYLVFSFDDGREDTYRNAYPTLTKYNYKFTVNIASDYIENPNDYQNGSFKNRKSMSVEQIFDLYRQGIEIASHGHKHTNNIEDIKDSISCLKKWGIDVNQIGFASPYSLLTDNNIEDAKKLIENGLLSYIRSGIQVRRSGLLYSIFYLLQEKLHLKWLFFALNRKCYVHKGSVEIPLVGVTITNKTTVAQIKYLLKKIPEGCGVILILHSILSPDDYGYKIDRWGWDIENLQMLCQYISQQKDISVCTNKELLKL